MDEQARHPALVRWLALDQARSVTNAQPDAAAQLAELKKQLAELSRTVEKLETVIGQPAPPAEQKPENQDKK